MEPCEQKDNISRLFTAIDENRKSLHEMGGDLKYVKDRLDDGLKDTSDGLKELIDSFNAVLKLEPIIKHHEKVVSEIEGLGWWISKSLGTVIVVTIVGLTTWAISKGWKP